MEYLKSLSIPIDTALSATSEDRFVKSKRSLDVGDREKVCDRKPILRRHLIAFLLDFYLVHRRLQFGIWQFLRSPEYVGQYIDFKLGAKAP